MEFLKGGSASTGQLRVAIGLRAGQHPSNFLASALADGRIVRDGDYWSLGTKSATGAVESGAEPAPTPAAKPPAAKKSDCLFAVWSHGVVEIKKPEQPSLELTLDEVDDLVAFLTKMGSA
jgi:hypothetical protein